MPNAAPLRGLRQVRDRGGLCESRWDDNKYGLRHQGDHHRRDAQPVRHLPTVQDPDVPVPHALNRRPLPHEEPQAQGRCRLEEAYGQAHLAEAGRV